MPGLDIMHDVQSYAEGSLSVCEELDLFQRLIDTGLAWKLGDSIAHNANQLLMRGKLSASDETPEEIKRSIQIRQDAIFCFRQKGEEDHGNERITRRHSDR